MGGVMSTPGESVEAVRASYRPKRILTLFVGESAPQSGAFFYYNNTAMSRNVERAMKAAGLGRGGNFLECLKAYGWYLDDLVLTPVNTLETSLRKKKCQDAQTSLAARILEYRPIAIVSLLLSIKENVEAAANTAGSNAQLFAVPFPGNGQQARFQKEMSRILPQLPREAI
jgi:hypothetical protein